MTTLEQGKKSQVTLVEYHGESCVCKHYNTNGDPYAKCQREVGFLTWYSDIPSIPRLLEVEGDDKLIMSYIPGQTLRAVSKILDLHTFSQQYGKALTAFFEYTGENQQHNIFFYGKHIDKSVG